MQENSAEIRGSALSRLLWWLARFTLIAWGASSAAYLLLRVATGEAFWPVTPANIFAYWILLGSLIALLLALLLRFWYALLLNAPAALALVLLFGWAYVPQASALPGDGVSLRVMTYNLHSDYANTAGKIEAIRESDADIVALVQLGSETAEAIEAELSEEYPYRALYGGVNGAGLLSRYPIRSHTEPFSINTSKNQMIVRLDVQGQELQVIVVHLANPRPTREGFVFREDALADLQNLLATANAGAPTLLLGDFNMPDQTDAYRTVLAAGLRDAYFEAGQGQGPGFTFPAYNRWFDTDMLPFLRLDYIFYTEGLEATDARVLRSNASDHRPVVAELLLAVE